MSRHKKEAPDSGLTKEIDYIYLPDLPER